MHQAPKDFGEYMQTKKVKLEDQFEQNRTQFTSLLFKNLSFFINGYTEPPYQQLKSLISRHAGQFHHYYERERVTHVLTQEIPQNKFKFFSSRAKLVRPQWLLDCIEHNSLLPVAPYEICCPSRSSFVQNYFGTSRLHHLSKWRNELQMYAAELMKDKQCDRSLLVFHVDIDSFFVSASCAHGLEPDLIDKEPLGVAHASNSNTLSSSTSEIASCNYAARAFGIKNGMSVKKAIQLCPQLKFLAYNFDLYNEISRSFYKILSDFSAQLEAVSCDEAYLSVPSLREDCAVNWMDLQKVESKASEIKERIKRELKINVSIGASYNKLMARLCTKLAKPNGIHVHLDPLEAKNFISKFKIDDVPGIGRSSLAKLAEMGISSMEDLQNASGQRLKAILGSRNGEALFNNARGIDHSQLATQPGQKTTSVGINWGIRLSTQSELRQFLVELIGELETRLSEQAICKLTLKLMIAVDPTVMPTKYLGHGKCTEHSKSSNCIPGDSIIDKCFTLLEEMQKSLKFQIEALRGIGISVEKAMNLAKNSLAHYFLKSDTANSFNEITFINEKNFTSQLNSLGESSTFKRAKIVQELESLPKSFMDSTQLWQIKQSLRSLQEEGQKFALLFSVVNSLFNQRQFDCIQSLLSFVKRTSSKEFYGSVLELAQTHFGGNLKAE